VDFTFFDALDGTPGQGDAADARAVRHNIGRDLGFGELGCYRSHLALWRACAASHQPMLVLEDDLAADPDLAESLNWLVGRIERYGYVRLAAHHTVKARDLDEAGPNGRRLVRLSKGPWNTLAYAISPGGARRLLAGCTHIVRTVDEAIDRFWEHGVLPYAVLPYPIRVDAAHDSLIDADIVRKGWKAPSWAERTRLKLRRHGDSLMRRYFNLTHGG
jgi:glycosyl transferase family 25